MKTLTYIGKRYIYTKEHKYKKILQVFLDNEGLECFYTGVKGVNIGYKYFQNENGSIPLYPVLVNDDIDDRHLEWWTRQEKDQYDFKNSKMREKISNNSEIINELKALKKEALKINDHFEREMFVKYIINKCLYPTHE